MQDWPLRASSYFNFWRSPTWPRPRLPRGPPVETASPAFRGVARVMDESRSMSHSASTIGARCVVGTLQTCGVKASQCGASMSLSGAGKHHFPSSPRLTSASTISRKTFMNKHLPVPIVPLPRRPRPHSSNRWVRVRSLLMGLANCRFSYVGRYGIGTPCQFRFRFRGGGGECS